MSEALLRELHPRWRATPEVPVYRPVHGVIDLVLEERDGDATVATELHSQVRRVEQQLRWQVQKADALALQPDQQGRSISRLLVLRNTQATRDVVRAAAATFAAAYPARTADAVAVASSRDAMARCRHRLDAHRRRRRETPRRAASRRRRRAMTVSPAGAPPRSPTGRRGGRRARPARARSRRRAGAASRASIRTRDVQRLDDIALRDADVRPHRRRPPAARRRARAAAPRRGRRRGTRARPRRRAATPRRRPVRSDRDRHPDEHVARDRPDDARAVRRRGPQERDRVVRVERRDRPRARAGATRGRAASSDRTTGESADGRRTPAGAPSGARPLQHDPTGPRERRPPPAAVLGLAHERAAAPPAGRAPASRATRSSATTCCVPTGWPAFGASRNVDGIPGVPNAAASASHRSRHAAGVSASAPRGAPRRARSAPTSAAPPGRRRTRRRPSPAIGRPPSGARPRRRAAPPPPSPSSSPAGAPADPRRASRRRAATR